MGGLQRFALFLVIIGAINWGLIGFFRYDLVSSIFGGETTAISRVIFGLVGLSGLLCIPLLFRSTEDVEVEEVDRSRHRNLNYGTEFGDEPDFTDIKDKDTSKENRDKKK